MKSIQCSLIYPQYLPYAIGAPWVIWVSMCKIFYRTLIALLDQSLFNFRQMPYNLIRKSEVGLYKLWRR